MTSEGQIRVGVQNGHYDGFVKIVVMTPSNSKKWFPLSPYSMKTVDGVNFENYYQSSRVYPTVPYTKQVYSRWDSRVIWERDAEQHVTDGHLTSTYKKWRDDLRDNEDPVRYPVGRHWRKHAIYAIDAPRNASLEELESKPHLGYIEARKQIYLKTYVELVRKIPEFFKLREMVRKGTNILIIEVDGPHEESLDYYIERYNVDKDFIVGGTILATSENLNIMLNDTKHSFGHGYCLAWALLNLPFPDGVNSDTDLDEHSGEHSGENEKYHRLEKFTKKYLIGLELEELKEIAQKMGKDDIDTYKKGTKKGKNDLVKWIYENQQN
jgi:hypothetical protein